MNGKVLRIVGMCLCLVAAVASRSSAQQGPPGVGPGHSGGSPGLPGGPLPGMQRGSESRSDRQPADDRSQHHSPGTTTADQTHNALQFGPVGRWWDEKSVVSSVGISRQQQRKMDSIFDANRSSIVSSYKAFLKAQEHLDSLNKKAHPSQAQLFAAIDAVNQARSGLQKAASAMLLQVRDQMTAEQIDKLKKVK